MLGRESGEANLIQPCASDGDKYLAEVTLDKSWLANFWTNSPLAETKIEPVK